MANKKQQKNQFKKLLDAWVPPREAGDPVGCIATSFTFNSVFFEEECLGRFVRMESDPVEDGPVYLIEREEKLNSISCAAALVDHHHCKGNRSLRWDMVPVRMSSGIFHPKVSILCWSQWVRMIVSSANLTDNGYRRNQEIFGAMDFFAGSDAPVDCIGTIVDFLRSILEYTGLKDPDSPVSKRCLDLLERVQSKVNTWERSENNPRTPIRVHTVVSGTSGYPIIEQIKRLWGNGSPPSRADVISPFYNPSANSRPDQASVALWNILKQRGDAAIAYNATCTELEDGSGLNINAPYAAIKKAIPPNRRGLTISFAEVPEDFEADKDNDWGYRPLHLKALCVENDQRVCLLLGSSNFTNAGMGLNSAGHNNFEANLLYCVDKKGKERQSLKKCFPAGKKIEESRIVSGESILLQSEDSIPDGEVLPLFFGNALYSSKLGQQPAFSLTFDSQKYNSALSGWIIRIEEQAPLYTESQWVNDGKPASIVLPCPTGPPPSGFYVLWGSAGNDVWWPLVIDKPSSLPPPEELKNLPLEILINVLSSARPIHQVLRSWVKRREQKREMAAREAVDPHKRVDVSGFILQRTRKVSWALSALRDRLERPVATHEQLHWRLRGPIGVEALARAIIAEAKSDQERIFLTTELALELYRVEPKEVAGCLGCNTIKHELQVLIGELRDKVYAHDLTLDLALKRYVENVFRKIEI